LKELMQRAERWPNQAKAQTQLGEENLFARAIRDLGRIAAYDTAVAVLISREPSAPASNTSSIG
jgi:hypothetical protein